ncbi:hypothetical protein [Mangrovitalea sediminis]|uniref:hypothetical protein n=1 Tax=Mangrovitalea sediminis TaxID=1982043 RepID=UPI000BE53C68|nr:hypothetical protein [Mangrovitalea sediminis]
MINPAKYDLIKGHIDFLIESLAERLYVDGTVCAFWHGKLQAYADLLVHLDLDLWSYAVESRRLVLAYHRYLHQEQNPHLPRPSFQGWLIGTSVNVLRAA